MRTMTAVDTGAIKPPKGQMVRTQGLDAKGQLVYLITSTPDRSAYYLYAVTPDGKLTKCGRSRTPLAFDDQCREREGRGKKCASSVK